MLEGLKATGMLQIEPLCTACARLRVGGVYDNLRSVSADCEAKESGANVWFMVEARGVPPLTDALDACAAGDFQYAEGLLGRTVAAPHALTQALPKGGSRPGTGASKGSADPRHK